MSKKIKNTRPANMRNISSASEDISVTIFFCVLSPFEVGEEFSLEGMFGLLVTMLLFCEIPLCRIYASVSYDDILRKTR